MINRKKWTGFLTGSLFFIALPALWAGGCSPAQSENNTQAVPTSQIALVADTVAPEKDSLRLDTPLTFRVIGVGDMMLGTNYPRNYLPANGGKDLLADMVEMLSSADVTFGNLEGTILDEGGTPKRCSNPDLCYAFRSPDAYAEHFRTAGFDLLSLANNHSGDFGPVGRKNTKQRLDEMGIAYAGLAGSDEWAVIERKGKRFGLAAFAPNRGTCDIRSLDYARRIVGELSERCDIVIVSFHGGAEGAKNQHVPRKAETYYGENRGNVYAFAHAVIDAGADIVFGHGPHVTRGMELYKDRFIIYSLGNFCTYGRFNLRGPAGVAPLIDLEVDAAGRFVSGRAVPVYQTKTTGPRVDAQKRALNYLRELSEADFPESPLLLDEEGNIRRK